VYVDDVVKANMLLLGYEGSGVFNVGTGKETSVLEIFSQLRAITGSQCEEKHLAPKKGEQERSSIDASSFGKTFGWKPETKLRDGLERTVEFFRNGTRR
jgi:UDP-glucose 4-epimerase